MCEACSNQVLSKSNFPGSYLELKLQDINNLKLKKNELLNRISGFQQSKRAFVGDATETVQSKQSDINKFKSNLDQLHLNLLEETLNLSSWYHKLEKLRENKEFLKQNVDNQEIVIAVLESHLHRIAKLVQVLRCKKLIEVFVGMQIEVPALFIDTNHFSRLTTSDMARCCKLRGFICELPFPLLSRPWSECGLPLEYCQVLLLRICSVLESISTILNISLLYPISEIKESVLAISVAAQSAVKSSAPPWQWESLPPEPEVSTHFAQSSQPQSNSSSPIDESLLLLQSNVIYICKQLSMSSTQIFEPQYIIHNLCMIKLRCMCILSEHGTAVVSSSSSSDELISEVSSLVSIRDMVAQQASEGEDPNSS